ncbi:MAG: EAL domain-containing protein [Azonexus sp.]|nr:EAL domain-containing protein [Azonexus sp.]
MLIEKSTALAEALKRCENEPIQFIGAIQSHGVLLAIDQRSMVQGASSNLFDLLGIAASGALNQPASQILGQDAWTSISALPASRQPLPIALSLLCGESRVFCQAQVHQANELLVVEIEIPSQRHQHVHLINFDSMDSMLSGLLADAASIDTYAGIIADQVQNLTGFDRVMVYQFDRQWNGKIIAESLNEGIASYLGNHFPASDIPPPARELYTQNLVRILVDRDAPAVPLHHSPKLSIDLSFSVLRSMAPIHLEYLRNLGVRASLTVSLMQNGRLWGLIACHHESPRQLSFKLRQAMELVAKTVATQLSAIAFVESSRFYAMVRDLLPRLVGLMQDAPGESILALDLQQEVLALVRANGAVIATGPLTASIGICPGPEQLQPLLEWLRPQLLTGKIFTSNALATDYPPAASFSEIASGLLAISLDEHAEQLLLWFREEVVRSIPWAGEAVKYLVEDAQGPKLEPRHSFERWVEMQRGESPPWSEPEVDAARMLSLTLAELFARQQLKIAEDSRRLAASVYENSSEAMLVADADNVILNVNPAFTVLTGFSAEEAVGKTPAILKSGKHDPAFYQAMWASLLESGTWSGEIWNRRKSGELLPEWLTINSITDESGAVHRWVALFTDITERKQAEAALHDSEVRFRSVFEKANTGMAIADPEGVLLDANDSLAEVLGYSRQEMIGMNIADFTHPDDLAVEIGYLTDLEIGLRDDYRIEKRYLTRTGDILWVDLMVTVIRDDQKRAINLIGLSVDITDRKRTEADLRIAATAFQSQEGIMITDADNVILRVNRAFTTITGYTSDEAVGQTPSLLGSGRHDAKFFATMRSSIEGTGSWQGEIWNRRKNGEVFPQWLSITAVKGLDNLVTHYVGTFTDITERKAAADKIEHLAFYDHLTQLPNRRLMLDRLGQAFNNGARRKRHGALMLIDLDNFKTLNDTLGHAVGDLLLLETASRLLASVRNGDTVARLGGDEFVVILEDLDEDDQHAALQAKTVAEKIHARLAEPYQLDVTADGNAPSSRIHHSTTSIGISLFKGHAISADELVKRADTAMYQAKGSGRNTLRFFDPEMQAAVQARAALELDLRKAISEQQFLLHFQAQMDSGNRVLGAEVLVRWLHPERGLISPAAFIPLAEETGLILQLGHWVMETACIQLAAWATQPDTAHLTLAVNVSAKQFSLQNFVEQVVTLLERTGARPEKLKLELTESLLLDNAEDIITKMNTLKALGVLFSLDDFGTGYSSLSYLKRLPLDQLKIDQSFVRDILTDANDAAIAQTVVALGKSLGLEVIAEGVETDQQREILASLGCLSYQGYFFSRPIPLADFEKYNEKNQPSGNLS